MLNYLQNNQRLRTLNKSVQIKTNSSERNYSLGGIVYFDHAHYMSRVLVDDIWWFHDGISIQQTMVKEHLDHNEFDLTSCRGKRIATAIYHA